MILEYKDLVRAYSEWETPLFASARRTSLGILDVVQHDALKMVLGCMRSTPVPVLLSEANETSLGIRRTLLIRNVILRNFTWS